MIRPVKEKIYAKMNTKIEIQLNKTIIVVGPTVTASVLGKDSRRPPFSFESMKTILMENTLQDNCTIDALQQSTTSSNVVDRLREMQRQGALLAYLYPDNVLATAMEQEPLTAVLVEQWLQQQQSCRSGIMHIFGSCRDVGSMQCLEMGKPTIPESILRVFSDRTCVCVGFGLESEDKGDLAVFLNQLPPTTNVLVAHENDEVPDNGIGLPVAVESALKAVYPIGDTSKALGSMIEHCTNDLGRPVSFLMASKTNYVKTAMLLSSLPGMNFQMMNNIEYNGLTFHVLTAQINCKKFSEFWHALMRPSVVQILVNSTVLAIMLDQFTFVWLNGERTIVPSSQSSVEELNTSMSSCSSITTTQEPTTLSFGIASVLKQQKTLPRYTIRKQKIDPKFSGDNALPPSVFKRRMSLPHGNSLTMAAAATANGSILKGKSIVSNSTSTTPSKQQLLLARYFYNQRKIETNSSTSEKEDCKTLRHLLQEKKTDFPKPSNKAMNFLSDWIVEKRKALFISESNEWSSQINDDLVKKMAKWQRLREKRLAYLKKRQTEEENRVRRSSLDSSASSTSDSLRYHLSAVSAAPGYPASVQSPLLATVNPYLIPQQTTTNFASGIRTAAPMVYQSPYLSSYPLLAPVPVPYLLPGTSNLVLVSSNNSLGGIGSSSTLSTSGGLLKPHTTGIPLTTSSFVSPLPTSSTCPPSIKLADVKPKRKRSNPEKSTSVISSLLMSKELTPPMLKQSRMVSSPASVSDEKCSDGEESNSDHVSCDSTESENSRLSLWKFLLELLLTNSYSSLIDWRRIHALEFHIKQPQDVAKLWSTYKSDSSIDCTRFKKALRYYCNKEQPILHHVMGKEDNVYQFSSSMLYYINNRYSQFQRSNLSPSTSSATLEQAQDMCGSQEVLVVD